MQILGGVFLLLVTCSVLDLYQRFLLVFLGLFGMDCASCLRFLTQSYEFGCGFFVLGRFSKVFNILGLFLLFVLGLKFLQYGWHGKSLMQFLYHNRVRDGFCSNPDFDKELDSKIMPCKRGPVKFLRNGKSRNKDNLSVSKDRVNQNIDVKAECDFEDNDNCTEFCEEDEEFDVRALRRMVKIERKRANVAYGELEQERMAASGAANEAMAMILRLQNEKSSIEIQSNQYRRLTEQKQEYDQEIIQSLQWIVTKHESERGSLEDKLKLCRQKLKSYMSADEMDEFEGVDTCSNVSISSMADSMEEGTKRSLDMDLGAVKRFGFRANR